jgi:hypothetical protein
VTLRRSLAVAGALALVLTLSISLATAEVNQLGNLRISFNGKISPDALPRHGSAAVRVEVGARISSTNGQIPAQLRRIAIEINRNGRLDPTGIPVCHLSDIQPSTTENALAACRRSMVGEGHFSAKVVLSEQAPFPSEGKVIAFNGREGGGPAILAHVYGTKPVPTSYTLVFSIKRGKGKYGTVLRASLPKVTGRWGYVTGLSLRLGRNFSHGGKRSYLSAACPAPAGFPSALFPFARVSMGFDDGRQITQAITRVCRVRD